ncbi:MAG: (d)CMP kinase [Chlamydiia bacterium]|nr:(d)CMP kinase [Chlamydiia bacterium]
MIIAIDGPSGTGKSTVAKELAHRLGFTFFDTGAMYRSFAWKIVQENIDPTDQAKVVSILPRFGYSIRKDQRGERRYFVGDQDVTEAIREVQISPIASQIATYSEVRKALVKIQRAFGHRSDAVFEGRDMGTVVFPDADLKIFLTARPAVRAKRRYHELMAKFPDLAESLNIDQVQKELEERDLNDMNRSISPLRQASDAILIDTSDLSVSQVVGKIIRLGSQKENHYPKMKWAYRIIYLLARGYFRLFFRLKIYGLEHYRRGKGVLAANHNSNLDPPVLSVSCPEEVHFLAKESLFHVPLLGRLIRTLNSHPVSRGASDAQTFRTIIQLLQHGHKVILFPEGSRSFDGELQPIERGLPFLVQKSQSTVFPAYIEGTFQAWPRTQKMPKLWGKITCVFGSPIEWEDFEGLDKRQAEEQISQRIGRSLRELRSWLQSGAKGSPP